jgi:hypothetical protein
VSELVPDRVRVCAVRTIINFYLVVDIAHWGGACRL